MVFKSSLKCISIYGGVMFVRPILGQLSVHPHAVQTILYMLYQIVLLSRQITRNELCISSSFQESLQEQNLSCMHNYLMFIVTLININGVLLVSSRDPFNTEQSFCSHSFYIFTSKETYSPFMGANLSTQLHQMD